MKKVAIFDIDGTIFRSSLLIEITEALIESGAFKATVKKVYAKAHQNWLNRKDTYDKYIWAVIKAFEGNIKGVDYKDFMKISKKIIDAKKDQTYQYTRDLVKELQGNGYFLLAISNSPKVLVDVFASQLGFDKSYGRMYEVDEKGKFTGKTLHSEIIGDKSKILQSALEKENLTLRSSIAVGDTEADIPMFKMVEKPICFNPNKGLFAVAKRKGWKVVVERKDTFYEIQK
jgi:HAD superfamily hydrolase (TIGR01490 family)